MESKHLMIIGIIGLFFLQNIILLEPQSHTNNNMDKIIFNNVSPSQLYYSYNISIHNSPSGNGYYQQLITLKNYSIYNINSNGSNFYVAYENNTLIYTWVQSINKTVISFWSKILNGTSIIKIDVYNNKTNLFSSKGYLGIAPQYSATYNQSNNAMKVFSVGDAFLSSSDMSNYSISAGSSSVWTIGNGLSGLNTTSIYNILTTNNHYLPSNYMIVSSMYYGANSTRSGNPEAGFGFGSGSSEYDNIVYYGGHTYLSMANLTGTVSVLQLPFSNTTANSFTYRYISNNETQIFINDKYYNVTITNGKNLLNSGLSVDFTVNNQYLHVNYWYFANNIAMPTYTQSTNQFYSLNIISKNNGTIINNSYIYNGLFYSNNYINFTVNYSKFSNFYVYALNYSTNFPQYTQFLLTINNYTDNNSGLYYFGTLTILYHTQSIKPLRETTFTQYNMYFLIVIIIFILGLIIYGYKRG